MKTIYSKNHIFRNSKTELYGGELVRPFECPERVAFILNQIEKENLGEVLEPHEIDLEIIFEVHDRKYVEFLDTAWEEWQNEGFNGEAIPTVWPSRSMNSDKIPKFIEGKLGYYCLASETSISEGSIKAAYDSAKVAIASAEMMSDNTSIFALCRPPGHHASKDQYGGYCFFNNAAIAAEKLKSQGASRIFILDIDFHHGNGTQAIFYDRSDVFYASLHGDPMHAFPHFLGHLDEKGLHDGEGFNANYPMGPGTDYGTWSKALDQTCNDISSFKPDVLIISLGVDIYENDPISFFKVKSEDFVTIGQKLAKLKLPTLFIMEGGYAVQEIGINTVNTLKGYENG